MKKFITIFICTIILTGCSAKPERLDDKALNCFSYDSKILVQSVNPDLVTMDYLIKHPDDYVTPIDTTDDDFFVVVKGKVTSIKVTDYSKEDLSIMDNKEAAELLSSQIGYEYNIDDSTDFLSNYDDIGITEDKEYYFMVCVREIGNSYSFLVLDAFEAN